MNATLDTDIDAAVLLASLEGSKTADEYEAEARALDLEAAKLARNVIRLQARARHYRKQAARLREGSR